MKRCRSVLFLLFSCVLTVLVLFGSQLQVRTVSAVPNFTNQNSVPLGSNTCAGSGCHTSSGSPGSAVVTGFPSGMTYTPGTPIPLTLTINDSSQNRFGFELTARLVSNTANAAGTWAAGTNSNTGTNVVPVVQGLANSSTFNFTWTPPATASGNVNFYLTGLAGSFPSADLYTAMYTLTPAAAAPKADYSLAATNATVVAGATGTSTLTVTPTNGFTGTIALSASGLPSGVTLSPSSVTGSGTLTLTASSTATAGTKAVTLTGTSGALTHTATFNVTVSAAAPKPDFSLSASPSSLTITQGTSGTDTLTVTPSGGFSGTISLSAAGLPSGVTMSPASVTGSAPLTFTASSTATTGTFPITLTGTSGALSHTASFSLTVNSATAAKPDFSISASPSSLTIAQGASGTSTISVAPVSGFSGSVALSIPGLPTGVTAAFSPTSTTGTSALTLSASSTAASMTVGLTVTGTSGSLTHTTTVNLTVNAATGTGSNSLTASPTSLTFNYQGGGSVPSAQKVGLTTKNGSLTYSGSTSGGPWLSTSPMGGTAPGSMMVSVNPTNMSTGTYTGAIQLSAPGVSSSTVHVTLNITSSSGCGGDGCGGGNAGNMSATPFVNDPSSSGTLTAQWVDLLGVPTGNQSLDPGLVLSKDATAPTGTQTGATISNAQGSLTELGFDYRVGGQCTATSPRFIVVTTDSVTHTVGGCSKGTNTAAPVVGWRRVRFNLTDSAQTSPVILPGDSVSSITLVMDQGPEMGPTAAGGLVVIDNIDINGTIVGKVGSTVTPPPTQPPPPTHHHRQDD